MNRVAALAFGLLVLGGADTRCLAAPPDAVQSAVEGVYVLEAWYADGTTYRPPQVEGRVVQLNGQATVILVNRIEMNKQITTAAFGVYTLRPDTYSYRYDSRSVFTETPGGITVSHAPAFDGMRSFDVVQEGATVHLRSRTAEQAEFAFSPDGFTYSEGGHLLRSYRRAKEE